MLVRLSGCKAVVSDSGQVFIACILPVISKNKDFGVLTVMTLVNKYGGTRGLILLIHQLFFPPKFIHV